MSPQSVVLSLFIMFISFGSCFGSHKEEAHSQTNSQRYTRPRRLLEIKHEHFGIMSRAHKSTPSSRSQRTFNVANYGAKSSDGRDDNEVT